MTTTQEERPAVLGIDIGGSSIKAAPVDVERGTLVAEPWRVPTPQPSVPAAVVEAVSEVAEHFRWSGPVGCALPSVVKDGVVHTAANIDSSWIGTDGQELFTEAIDCPVALINDADAAGMAEIAFGAGRDRRGVVIMVTLGTGIGSAIFIDGKLLPNTELGHLVIRGRGAETRASARNREQEGLDWKTWAGRVDEYLRYVESLFCPDLFIVGGGVSEKHDQFFPHFTTMTPVVPAELRNDAGIVGAALAARSSSRRLAGSPASLVPASSPDPRQTT